MKKTQKIVEDLEAQIAKEIKIIKEKLVKERKQNSKSWDEFDDENAHEDAISQYERSSAGKQQKQQVDDAWDIVEIHKTAYEGKKMIDDTLAQKQKWFSKAFCVHDGNLYVWMLLPEKFTAKQTQTIYPDGYNIAYRLERAPTNVKMHIACIPLKVANELKIYMTLDNVHTQSPIPKEFIYEVLSFKEKPSDGTIANVITKKSRWSIIHDKREYTIRVQPLGLLAKLKFW